ncbi:hypothetical protein [Neisseria arctica]|nr:hypothetical protein [Neisseria arctica]
MIIKHAEGRSNDLEVLNQLLALPHINQETKTKSSGKSEIFNPV